MAATVLVSYDMETPPGGQEEFKAAMEERKWSYTRGGISLPASTCFGNFPNGTDPQSLLQSAINAMRVAEAAAQVATDKRCRIERYAISVVVEGVGGILHNGSYLPKK